MAGPGFESLILHQPEALLPELTHLKSWLDWCCQLLIQWPFKVTLKFVHRWRGRSCPVQSFSSSSERNAIWRAIALRNGSCHCPDVKEGEALQTSRRRVDTALSVERRTRQANAHFIGREKLVFKGTRAR